MRLNVTFIILKSIFWVIRFMEIKDFVQRELDSVVANGGVQQDDFSPRSINGNIEVLEKGWVFQTFGKVFRNVVNKKAGTFAEYKLGRMFKLKADGTVDKDSMRIVPIYPSFFNKRAIEVNDSCQRTGNIVMSDGPVCEAYKSYGSVPKGFANAIDGKVIKVDNVTVTQIKRFGTEADTTNTKTYTLSYADDVKLPEIAE